MSVETPSTAPLPGERASSRIAHGAVAFAGVVALFAAVIVYGWWMKLLVTHIGSGLAGLLEWCLFVFMGALGIAAVAGLLWSVTQNRIVRRAAGHAPYTPPPGVQSPPRRND